MNRDRMRYPSLGLLLAACVLLFGGCCGDNGETCPPCDDCPTLPDPGPIIDINEGGGDLCYQCDDSSQPDTINPTSNTIDPDYLLTPDLIVFIDTANHDIDYVGKNKKITVKFDDGTKFEIERGGAIDPLRWSCYNSSMEKTDIVAGNSGDIPACLLSTTTRLVTDIEYGTEYGDMIILEMKE